MTMTITTSSVTQNAIRLNVPEHKHIEDLQYHMPATMYKGMTYTDAMRLTILL